VTVSERIFLEHPEKGLPRWVEVPAGLFLGLITLFLAYACGVLMVDASRKAPILSATIGLLFLLICLWILGLCWRLMTGRKNRGGLMSPRALRVVSIFCLIFPVAGLFTGYYRQHGVGAVVRVVDYFGAFAGLQIIARRREAEASRSGTIER
jgi:hypothetical protein